MGYCKGIKEGTIKSQEVRKSNDADVGRNLCENICGKFTSVQERILLIMLQYQIFRQAIWNSTSFLKIILDNLYQDSPKERFKIPVINSDFLIF